MAVDRVALRLRTTSSIRPLATKWWFWSIWSQVPCATEAKMEEEIHPGPRTHRFSVSHNINIWGKARRGRHYPGPRLIQIIETMVPGTRRQIYSPFWLLLDASDPLSFWQKSARNFVDGHTAELMRGSRRSNEETHALHFVTARTHIGADRLFMLVGAYFDFTARGELRFARQCIDLTIKALLASEQRTLGADHTECLFAILRTNIWTSNDAQHHLRGYDFKLARQIHLMFSDIHKAGTSRWLFARRPHAEEVLTGPGAVWSTFLRPCDPLILGIEANETSFRFHIAEGQSPAGVRFPDVADEICHFEWPDDPSSSGPPGATASGLALVCLIIPSRLIREELDEAGSRSGPNGFKRPADCRG